MATIPIRVKFVIDPSSVTNYDTAHFYLQFYFNGQQSATIWNLALPRAILQLFWQPPASEMRRCQQLGIFSSFKDCQILHVFQINLLNVPPTGIINVPELHLIIKEVRIIRFWKISAPLRTKQNLGRNLEMFYTPLTKTLNLWPSAKSLLATFKNISSLKRNNFLSVLLINKNSS